MHLTTAPLQHLNKFLPFKNGVKLDNSKRAACGPRAACWS